MTTSRHINYILKERIRTFRSNYIFTIARIEKESKRITKLFNRKSKHGIGLSINSINKIIKDINGFQKNSKIELNEIKSLLRTYMKDKSRKPKDN